MLALVAEAYVDLGPFAMLGDTGIQQRTSPYTYVIINTYPLDDIQLSF